MEFISIEKELKDFKEHLSNNDRTILSAKFGDGKTYFLQCFKEKYKDEYEFITIYPVNYQIAENKAVFEYIKRDILIQMIVKGMIGEDYRIPKSLMFQYFIMNNSKTLLSDLLSVLPVLGIPEEITSLFLKGYKAVETCLKMTEGFNKYKDAIENQKSENIVDAYLEELSKEKGSPYEMDMITHIIINNITSYVTKHPKKKIVLVIEDLDRLDPAHLFRILNVFSAHIDRKYQLSTFEKGMNATASPELLSNKFGFDKIITVFDYATAECVFKHFYGPMSNYEGYIGKFLSHAPFSFSINEVANRYLIQLLNDECHIEYNNLPDELRKRLNALSVRDIQKITDDYTTLIREDFCEVNPVYKLRTKAPLTKFIAILALARISKEEVYKYILDIPFVDVVKCLDAFLVLHTVLMDQKYIVYRGTAIRYYLDSLNGIINRLSFNEPVYLSQPTPEFKCLTPEMICKCIDVAFMYVNV